ncbi:MAG: hypothetical protein R2788_16735 [Saprospiraceae bacterium]
MTSADLFVQPSFTENFANAVIENLSVSACFNYRKKLGSLSMCWKIIWAGLVVRRASSIFLKVIEDIFYKKEELINIEK